MLVTFVVLPTEVTNKQLLSLVLECGVLGAGVGSGLPWGLWPSHGTLPQGGTAAPVLRDGTDQVGATLEPQIRDMLAEQSQHVSDHWMSKTHR